MENKTAKAYLRYVRISPRKVQNGYLFVTVLTCHLFVLIHTRGG